jgi:4-hydroxy-2-oxoglutarate aldolase
MAETPELRSGIYPPLPTFFTGNDELDLRTLRQHIRRIADSGIAGYVVMGTNGEAVHLNGEERIRVIETTRATVGEQTLVLAGCGEQSTRATITLCRQARKAGADFALILPPSYFKGRMDSKALLAHYRAVAESSPLPIVIYNMPASAAGLDLDAATICALAEHPNIIGVKDSSGNIAKLSQVAASTPERFRVFAGSAGYLLPALAVGAVGAVAALANIFPLEVCRLQELFESGQMAEARVLQARLVPSNTAVTNTYSVAGLKAALNVLFDYGGSPRSPLQALTEQERDKLAVILRGV